MEKDGPDPGPSKTKVSEDSEEPFIIPVNPSNLKGCHPKSGITDETSQPRKKVKLSPSMNPHLCNEENKTKLKELWKSDINGEIFDAEIISDPFKVCVIENFLENSDFVEGIIEEFNDVEWCKRKMDLYEFFQSKDLKHFDQGYIRDFYEYFKNSVMSWVSEITGYPLIDISATCSCYTNTDYLLVHDDQREDRMVAFVYYLIDCESWDFSKGGSLDLFSKDENGLPLKVVNSILPKNNQLVLFPVTNDSYHQVSEVTSLEDNRLSINGWFHVKNPPIFKTPHFEYPAGSLFGKAELKPIEIDLLLESWIQGSYLNKEDGTLEDIQKHIEENSEISLKEFFRIEALDEVENCLDMIEETAEKWRKSAPPNRSSYEVLHIDNTLPHSLKRFLDLFQSDQFFSYLKIITDIEFRSMKFEFQRWTSGNYCLLSDYNWSKEELDVVFYIPCGEENDVIGGRIQYVNIEEEVEEALITIEPSKNTLNLVYRDTARFTNYFSKQSRCKKFYLLICTYSE